MIASDKRNQARSGPNGKRRQPPRQELSTQLAAAVLLLLASGVFAVANTPEVPAVSANLGPCSVDFTVQDSAHKPIYDAKIDLTFRYGFLSMHKTELEVGTNSDGKARIEGLPTYVKKPLQFIIRHDRQTKTITHDPAAQCHTSYTVVFLFIRAS